MKNAILSFSECLAIHYCYTDTPTCRSIYCIVLNCQYIFTKIMLTNLLNWIRKDKAWDDMCIYKKSCNTEASNLQEDFVAKLPRSNFNLCSSPSVYPRVLHAWLSVAHDKLHETWKLYATRKRGPRKHVTCCHAWTHV